MSHTPTPWTNIASKKSGLWHIESSIDAKVSGEPVCSVPSRNNAAFIVRACNSHEDLVKALKSACVAMSFKYGFDGDKDLGAMEADKKYGSSFGSVYLEMREALAKASGKANA